MARKKETDPLDDDEWLFRRVHADRFRTDKSPYVSPGAFEPRVRGNQPDVDGISLFRADCLEQPSQILELIVDPEKRRKNGVVKVLVAEVRGLGLSIVLTPRDDIPGHVSIAELSSETFADKEKRPECKLKMTDLAKLSSSESRIVLEPTPVNPRTSD